MFVQISQELQDLREKSKEEQEKIIEEFVVRIKGEEYIDDGRKWIIFHIHKDMSKSSVEKFLRNRPREEDRYCYVGSMTKPSFEIHYNRDGNFVLFDQRSKKVKVSLYSSFDNALKKIQTNLKGLVKMKVSTLVSDLSDDAIKYKFDTGER